MSGKTSKKVFTAIHLMMDIIKDLELDSEEYQELQKIISNSIKVAKRNGGCNGNTETS